MSQEEAVFASPPTPEKKPWYKHKYFIPGVAIFILLLVLFFSSVGIGTVKRIQRESDKRFKKMEHERDSIERARKPLLDSLKAQSNTIYYLENRQAEYDQEISAANRKINQIRRDYEKLNRFNTFNSDSVRKYFSDNYQKD